MFLAVSGKMDDFGTKILSLTLDRFWTLDLDFVNLGKILDVDMTG